MPVKWTRPKRAEKQAKAEEPKPDKPKGKGKKEAK